jgi:hypothetical protein
MPRNQGLFSDAPLWCRPSDGQQFFPENEVDSVLREIGVEQGYPHKTSTIKFTKRSKQKRKSPPEEYRQHACYYSTEPRGGCKFAIRQTRRMVDDQYYFQVGNCDHGDHLATPGVLCREALTSPSKLTQTPGDFIRKFAQTKSDTNYVEQKKVKEAFQRIKYSRNSLNLPKGVSMRSRAAVVETLEKYLYSTLLETGGFTEDTVFLCKNRQGKSYLLDDGPPDSAPRVVAVFATEELLLNLFRQISAGQDIHIQLDASYRYTTERKLGYIPVKVSSLTQTGRSVAKAVVTKEDSEVHEFIVESVIASVEEVVNRRCERGDKYV